MDMDHLAVMEVMAVGVYQVMLMEATVGQEFRPLEDKYLVLELQTVANIDQEGLVLEFQEDQLLVQQGDQVIHQVEVIQVLELLQELDISQVLAQVPHISQAEVQELLLVPITQEEQQEVYTMEVPVL